VEVDAELLDRVVSNLLSNAIKYSPPDSPIQLALSADGSAVHLAIQDHGIGLAPDEINGLFQRYSRAHGAVERGVEGVGLGLYLSRRFVEAHGGRIWAESAGRGRGATVHVLLPRTLQDGEEVRPVRVGDEAVVG
jgi:signal transduction histidine kinase